MALLTLLLASLLGLGADSASAAWLHPALSDEFGPDGTAGTVFMRQTVAGIGYDQAHKRFYAARPELGRDGAGRPFAPQPVRGIYGFDMPAPGTRTPLEGSFPAPLPTPTFIPAFEVDESEGNVYYLDGKKLYAFDSKGEPLGEPHPMELAEGSEVSEGRTDMEVDPFGYIWIVQESQERILKYDPDGTLLKTVSLAPLKPRRILFDRDTGDLWAWGFGIESGSRMTRWTASSDYTEFDRIFPLAHDGILHNFTFDSTRGVFYLVNDFQQVVNAYNEDGVLLETVTAPSPAYKGVAVNEATGELYVYDDHSTQFTADNAKYGKVLVFNGVVVPDVTTGPPSSVGHTSTTITGHVGPASGPGITECKFQYGTTTSYSSGSVPCAPAASEGSPIEAGTDVSAELSGLATATEYHYRLVAKNANGTSYGLDETVIPQPSLVKTGAATNVARTSATLNGTADPEGLASTVYFEYGKTKKYGTTTSAPPGESLGTTTPGDQPVSKGLAGLEPGATYHYRLVEVNSNGTSYGVDRAFTTVTAVKHLSTNPAEPVGRVGATLRGTLDPDGLATDYYFEYGKSVRYGKKTAAPPGEVLVDISPGDKQVSAVISGLKPETTYHFRLVASNATYGTTKGQDRTFTTPPSIKGIETEAATEVLPAEATLHGSLDPDGFDTTFYFDYGKTKSYGHSIPAPPGEDVGASDPGSITLSKTLEGLEPGTTYHFRIVAVNETGSTAGQDETFATPQGPSIEGVFSANVTASSADLRARINPNGTEPSFETIYRFQYGTTTAYGQSVPVGDGTLSPVIGGQNVSVPISGLSEVTYHFRLIAENDWGTVVSEDQTLDFKAPSSCPNTTVRQQTGAAYLPDCRAYELVSPGNAGGAVLSPDAPSSPHAANRFVYSGAFTAIPGSGDPPNGLGLSLYAATRTNAGWVTRYVGLPGDEALAQSGYPGEGTFIGNGAMLSDSSLDKFLTWRSVEVSFAVTEPSSYAPYVWDNEGNTLGRLPTNFEEVPGADSPPSEGGFTGDAKLSGDGGHYVFSSVGAVFGPGGLAESPGSVYDNDIAAGTVTVVSKTPADADIPKDGAAGSADEYIRIPALSPDGSHILMSTAAPGKTTHLYMTVDESTHYEVSLGEDEINHGVKFEAMREDGSEVFFTTAAQMTADDGDTSTDLYRWHENGGSPTLTRLSVGEEGSFGDSDACTPGSEWTTKCNVELVSTDRFLKVGSLRRHTIDNAFAPLGGTIYFYSPEQLEGSRGVPGMRNLYVWRNGAVHHVATLEPLGGASRINVSPDGSLMAFVTKTQIGAYENDGHAEMYRYDPQERTLLCVSCKPDGSSPVSDIEASQNGSFMTDDGRAFFSTEDALVPRDANGIRDVYEYVGGRAQLITTGTGDEDGTAGGTPIGLVGVSANGTDVFVSTYETLVGQDENGPFLKFYDARVNGGFPFNKPPAPCAAADECHGEGSSSPVAPTIGTGAGLGAGGNATEATQRKQAKRRLAKCRRQAKRRNRQTGQRRRAQCRRRRGAQR